MSLSITTLGNCGNQTATNECVGFLIDTDEKFIIDAGPGVVRQILKCNRRCSEFPHIFITHSHGDHTAGFPYLIWNYFYEKLNGIVCPDVINVYTFDYLREGLINMIEFCYGSVTKFPFKLSFHIIEEHGITEHLISQTKVSTIPVDHSTKTAGLKFEFNNKTFVYSSDTLYYEPLISFAQNADLLIHEGFVTNDLFDLSRKTKHGTALDAGKIAHAAEVKRLGLVHFFPPFSNKLNTLIKEAETVFNNEVFIPKELEVINL